MQIEPAPQSAPGPAQPPVPAPGWRAAPLVRVLASQAIGAALAFSASFLVTLGTGFVVPFLAVIAGQGIFAAWIGHRMKLPGWWVPVQIILPPATAMISALKIPAWLFLLVFAVLLLVFWNSARGRVPLYLTNRETWRALARLVEDRGELHFVDLGCGIGGALLYLAKMRPDAKFVGVESAPLPFFIAWSRARSSRLPNLRILYGDIWKHDLGEYDTAYAFLSPAPMPMLYEKVKAEMRPGTMFVSNSFTVPDAPPDQTVAVNDSRETQLFVWRR